jgi:3-hydroxyisobutyrate dehydrogenase-like beta-hydroxyacid dehydrogenase
LVYKRELEMSKIAFIGLGVMGYPMAGHLASQGHQVYVYNRTMAKAEAWQGAHGGHVAISPSEAALTADFVCICVGNDDDLRSVCYGDQGVLAGMAAGSTLIDHTTASAQVAREIAVIAGQQGVLLMHPYQVVRPGQKMAPWLLCVVAARKITSELNPLCRPTQKLRLT